MDPDLGDKKKNYAKNKKQFKIGLHFFGLLSIIFIILFTSQNTNTINPIKKQA